MCRSILIFSVLCFLITDYTLAFQTSDADSAVVDSTNTVAIAAPVNSAAQPDTVVADSSVVLITSPVIPPKQTDIKKSWFERWADHAEAFFWLVLFGVAGSLLVMIVALIFRYFIRNRKDIFRDNNVFIEVIEVPDNLKDVGYDGIVAARRIFDCINEIRQRAHVVGTEGVYNPVHDQPSLDLQVAGTKLSIQSMFRYIRILCDIPYDRICGEITEVGREEHKVVLRRRGKRNGIVTLTGGCVDKLIFDGTLELFEQVESYIAGVFHSRSGNYERAIHLAEICVNDLNWKKNSWAYNLWGLSLVRRGNNILDNMELQVKTYHEACEKLEQALEIDGNLTKAMNNYWYALLRWAELLPAKSVDIKIISKYEKACEIFRHAIVINPKLDTAIYYLAHTLNILCIIEPQPDVKKDQTREAIHLFQKYLKLPHDTDKEDEVNNLIQELKAKLNTVTPNSTE
jgi:tetratricopeptide (TPR) repeat protein